MTSLKRKIRKIKLDYSHSVFMALYEHNYYKRRESSAIVRGRHHYIINALRRALEEYSEYEKWKEKYIRIKKIEKDTNLWYNYLINKS